MPKKSHTIIQPAQTTEVSSSRRRVAFLIRTTGLLLGVAVAGLYEFLVCIAPPDDFDHMKPKTFLLMYVGGPLLMIMGAFWLADRIARRFDHRHISLSGD